MTGLDILNKLQILFEDTQEAPAAAFTYAMLAEMTRLVELCAEDGGEKPQDIIRAQLFIADQYMALRHFLYAKEHYLKALELFPQCAKDVFDDEEAAEMFEEGCVNLLKIYGNRGDYDAADRIYGLIGGALPERAEEIHRQVMKKPLILYDTVEYSDEYLAVLPELEAKIERELKGVKRRHGFCFQYWHTKEEILKRDYGIDWTSPAALNPRVRFD